MHASRYLYRLENRKATGIETNQTATSNDTFSYLIQPSEALESWNTIYWSIDNACILALPSLFAFAA
jgi:hypothetical protein